MELTHRNLQLCIDWNYFVLLSAFIFQWGWTPLIAACEKGHSEIAQLLTEKGADLNKQDGVYMTLILSLRHKHVVLNEIKYDNYMV